MNEIEFPQAIVDVMRTISFRLVYEDGSSEYCVLNDMSRILNETIPESTPIVVILRDNSFYCGIIGRLEDQLGEIYIALRSVVNISCVIFIPVAEAVGWCLMPIHHDA